MSPVLARRRLRLLLVSPLLSLVLLNACGSDKRDRVDLPPDELLGVPIHRGPIVAGPGGEALGVSWDGRLVVASKDGAWEVRVFRPEALSVSEAGVPNFTPDRRAVRSGTAPEFSASVRLEDTTLRTHAALALVADPMVGRSNPFRSDAECAHSESGEFVCYRAALFTHRVTDEDEVPTLGVLRAQIVIADAGSASAHVVSATVTSPFEPLLDSNDEPLAGVRPTVTSDGRLLILENEANEELFYSWNADPAASRGWTPPKPLTEMRADAEADVAGVAFAVRYPLARGAWANHAGQRYGEGVPFRGRYPWISPSADLLVYSAGRVNGNGVSVLGTMTGYVARYIDGPVNPDRYTTPRGGHVSFGMLPSLSPPFPGLTNAPFPYLPERPVLTLLGAATGVYSEVSFHPFSDPDYLVFLEMNELPDAKGGFSMKHTPDISGHLHMGLLNGGASFPPEAVEGIDESYAGIKGQSVYLHWDGSVVLPHINPATNETLAVEDAMSLHLWVRPLIDLNNAGDGTDNYQLLAHKAGLFEMRITEDRRIAVEVFVDPEVHSEPLALETDSHLPLETWSAVGLTYEATSGQVSIYINGEVVVSRAGSRANLRASEADLVLGPAGVNPGTTKSLGPLMRMDEVAFSRVARTPLEMMRAAYRRPLVTLPLGLRAEDLARETPRLSSDPEVELGRILFFDDRLWIGTPACSSCHVPGAVNRFTSGGLKAGRHTPVLFNRVFGTRQMWDGSADSLESLFENPPPGSAHENLQLDSAVAFLATSSEYQEMFDHTYGHLSTSSVADALTTFVRTIVSGNSRADQSDHGERDLSFLEERGRQIFFGVGRCASCHSGSNYSDELFHNTGLTSDANTPLSGRERITGSAYDRGAFKTPSLRDIALTKPYFHDGSAASLQEVIERYSDGKLNETRAPFASAAIEPLMLSTEEQASLEAFLSTLTGELTDIAVPSQLPVVGGLGKPTGLAPQGVQPETSGANFFADTFSWNAVERAQHYVITVHDLTDPRAVHNSSPCGAGQGFFCAVVTDPQVNVTELALGHEYRWEVRAVAGSISSETSDASVLYPAVPLDARFISQEVPELMAQNHPATVVLTFENTGFMPWTATTELRLSAKVGNWETSQANLPAEAVVEPGEQFTFSFPVTPASTGFVPFQWQLGTPTGAFGESSPVLLIEVRVDFKSEFVFASVPDQMFQGAAYEVQVTYVNTGALPWTRGEPIQFLSRAANPLWPNPRIDLPEGVVVSPGQSYTFVYNITAPSTPGTYSFQGQLFARNTYTQWIGESTPVFSVQVGDLDAEFISQNVPTEVVAGVPYDITLTFRNTGQFTWSRTTLDILGSRVPGVSHIQLSAEVLPGQVHTFETTLTAPSPGDYSFGWRMVRHLVKWHGDASPIVNVTARAPIATDSHFVSQKVPTQMVAGLSYDVSIAYQNVGTDSWNLGTGNVGLASQNPGNNTIWGADRIWASPGTVATGAQATYTATVTAPATPGTYDFQWQTLLPDGTPFGETTENIAVDVTEPLPLDSEFVSQTAVPAALATGQQVTVSLTFRNSGSTTWSLGNGTSNVYLSSESPANNTAWGLNRVWASSGSAAPGETVTYTFAITAPSAPGEYDFQWQTATGGMPFGAQSRKMVVEVF